VPAPLSRGTARGGDEVCPPLLPEPPLEPPPLDGGAGAGAGAATAPPPPPPDGSCELVGRPPWRDAALAGAASSHPTAAATATTVEARLKGVIGVLLIVHRATHLPRSVA